jgi:predicted transcriptional regulator
MDEDPLQLETRKRIFELVQASPGVHFREISRRLELPMGVVEYHLNFLIKRDMIVDRKEGRYRRYYAEGKIGSREKRVLSYLRKDIPRTILMHVMLHPGARHRDIKSELEISGSTLSFHLQHMISDEVLKEVDEGGTKRFYVVDPDSVSRTLILYRRSFMDRLVDSFTETWLDLEL